MGKMLNPRLSAGLRVTLLRISPQIRRIKSAATLCAMAAKMADKMGGQVEMVFTCAALTT